MAEKLRWLENTIQRKIDKMAGKRQYDGIKTIWRHKNKMA